VSRKLFNQIDYATPPQYPQGDPGTCWAEETYLVMQADAATPDRCVRCNAPALGFRLPRTFKEPTRQAGSGGTTIIDGIVAIIELLALIIHVSTRKSATVHLALCPKHVERRRMVVRVGWGLAIGGGVLVAVSILLIALGLEAHGNALLAALIVLVIGLVSLISGIILAGHAGSVLEVHKIDGQRVWLMRAGARFLASLPKRSVENTALQN
jgi:hypothetical protein